MATRRGGKGYKKDLDKVRYDIPEIVEDIVLLDLTPIENAFYSEAKDDGCSL